MARPKPEMVANPPVAFECPGCYGRLQVQLTADWGMVHEDQCICHDVDPARERRIVSTARSRHPQQIPSGPARPPAVAPAVAPALLATLLGLLTGLWRTRAI